MTSYIREEILVLGVSRGLLVSAIKGGSLLLDVEEGLVVAESR